MAQRRGNLTAMNGYNGRRRAYFLADKPDPDPDPDAEMENVYDGGSAGKWLASLGKNNGAGYGTKSDKKAVKLTEAQRDKLVERFKEEYQAGWNKDRNNQEE